jgi:nucleoside-diphosphate-sugar epimerase
VRILFTGASSFTGSWLVRELAAAGHSVTAVTTRELAQYPDELRRRRIEGIAQLCRVVPGMRFGDASFLELASEGGWDLLAHHAAEVRDYKSPGFDCVAALANNSRGLPQVLETLCGAGCGRVLLTGSVFEGGEGAGSDDLPDFSPYGLSKALTSHVFRFYCQRAGMALGKFVIPNPFGPFEEPRYTAYLMTSWLAGKTPTCSSPDYVRDNIHVSLLAKAYVRFAGELPDKGFAHLGPSGYAESQGAFTERVAAAMRRRLNLPCPVQLAAQTDFSEPRVRVNTDRLDTDALGWDESSAWDDMAAWYLAESGR